MREESLIVEPRGKNYKRNHETYKIPSTQQFAEEFDEKYQRFGQQDPESYYREPRRREQRQQQYEFRNQQQREPLQGQSQQQYEFRNQQQQRELFQGQSRQQNEFRNQKQPDQFQRQGRQQNEFRNQEQQRELFQGQSRQQNEFRNQQQREQFRGESRRPRQRQQREEEFNFENIPFASDQHNFYAEDNQDRRGIPYYERFQHEYPQSLTETNMRYPINRKFRKNPDGMQEPAAFYKTGRLPFHAKHPLNEERFFFEEPNRNDGFICGQYNFRGEQHARYYDERGDYPEDYFYERARENYTRPNKKKKKRDLRYFRTH